MRTILVSGRVALSSTSSPDGQGRIKERVTRMLAELEESVIRDGANPEVLARLEEARREVWE